MQLKTLKTKRLILRAWSLDDVNDLYRYASVDGVGQMAGWLPHQSLDESLQIIKDFFLDKSVYAIVNQENNQVIGSIGIHERLQPELMSFNQKEVGYVLAKDYWQKGLMTESLSALINYIFTNTDIEVLTCGHFLDNLANQKVMIKQGFTYLKDYTHFSQALNLERQGKLYTLFRKDYYEKTNIGN